jgi:hypothetical protein
VDGVPAELPEPGVLSRLPHDRRAAGLALAALVVLGASLFFVAVGPPPPPGFIRDEASVAYNAYAISHNLHDENGALLPIYFKSFGDYKSPIFVYVLAAVFRVTGPSKAVALATASTVVLLAILLLGLLAWRLTRSLFVTTATIVVGALTPWLFELGRDAYDTTIEPLLIALVLVSMEWARRSTRGTFVRALPVGLSLAGLAYSYAAGRLLSPLWAVALLAFAGRGRWRWLLQTWGVYVVSMVPMATYYFRHNGALSARYQSTTFVKAGMSKATIVHEFLSNYIRDADLGHWIVSGDPRPYIHVWGAPEFFAATLLLATVGVVAVLRRDRGDRFWLFVVVALVLSPAPAAITDQRYYSLRLLPIPMLLIVLAIPGIHAFWSAAQRDWPARLLLGAVAMLLALQFTQWIQNYDKNNSGRALLFEAGLTPMLHTAFRSGAPVYVSADDIYAQTQAHWFAVTHHAPPQRVFILQPHEAPPVGAMQFGRLIPCEPSCMQLQTYSTYWIARVTKPS